MAWNNLIQETIKSSKMLIFSQLLWTSDHKGRYLYKTQETNIHASAGFETAIPEIKRLQDYTLDRSATGIGIFVAYIYIYIYVCVCVFSNNNRLSFLISFCNIWWGK